MRSTKIGILFLGLLAVACDDSTNSPTSDPSPAGDVGASAETDYSRADAGGSDGDGKVYGVDAENYLVVFDRDRPQDVLRRVRITRTGGQNIVGIDFRRSAVAPTPGAPVDRSNLGKLYGITKSRVYEIDRQTGVASNGQRLTVPLVGTFFGSGFNPAVDRWRNHGNTEQNLRLNVDDGMTTADPMLAYKSGDQNFGRNPSVTGTGYTNSDNNPNTATELYAIDAGQDVLVELINPNDGQLSTVGRLGVRTNNYVGFDILGKGSRDAYASLTTGASQFGGSTLYRVNLDTGEARRVGDIRNKSPLVGITLEPES